MRTIAQTIGFICIAFWWLFFLYSQPGIIFALERITYHFNPPSLTDDVIHTATLRALEYSQKGSGTTQDIFFTQDEVLHLKDVAVMYRNVRVISAVAALLSLSFLVLQALQNKIDGQALRLACGMIGIFLGLSVLSLVLFSIFFVKFHLLFFPQGNWMFPDTSLLIQLFPELFWKLVLGSMILTMAFFVLLYWVLSQQIEERR